MNTVFITGALSRDCKIIEHILFQGIKGESIKLLYLDMFASDEYVKELKEKYGCSAHGFYSSEFCDLTGGAGEDETDFIEYITRHKNAFFTFVSFCIACSEASRAGSLWFSLNRDELSIITDSPEEYIVALNRLANQGTSEEYSIELLFPLEHCTEGCDYLSGAEEAETENNSSLILFSGGLDCTVAAYMMGEMTDHLELFNINYGQSNRFQEEFCAEKSVSLIKEKYSAEYNLHKTRCFENMFFSVLLDDTVTIDESNRASEYVPFRNSVFMNLGIMYGAAKGTKYIVTGSHCDDLLAPDGTLKYYRLFQDVISLQKRTAEFIIYPVLLYLGGKKELIYVGEKLGVHFEYCWSCHNYVDEHEAGTEALCCGTCGNCVTRYSAFEELGLKDPLKYFEAKDRRNNWSGWGSHSRDILEKLNIPREEVITV